MDASTIAALQHNPSQTITLYPSKVKWSLLLLASALFTAVGIWLALRGKPMGWGVAAFFGLGIPLSLLQLSGHAHRLIMEPDGFTIATIGRTTKFAWRDIEAISVVTMRHHRNVAFLLRGEPQSALARTNRALIGIDGMLPDTFGINVEELAAIFEQRRQLAAAARINNP
jgi:hypothetical protein